MVFGAGMEEGIVSKSDIVVRFILDTLFQLLVLILLGWKIALIFFAANTAAFVVLWKTGELK